MSTFITAIGTAVPQYKIEQESVAQWLLETLGLDAHNMRLTEALYEGSGIKSRYSVLADYSHKIGSFAFYPNTLGLEPFPSVGRRMEVYKREALPLALNAIGSLRTKKDFNPSEITHLITVSCTGMYAPGLDIELIETLGLKDEVERTGIQFMGCYAAFNALKSADYIIRSRADAKVLIVCLELCTLHFQKKQSRDNTVSNAIFGDGAAAVLVEGTPNGGKAYLSIDAFYSGLAKEGKRDMAWHIADSGFEMTLSARVPNAIHSGIRNLTEKLLHRFEIGQQDVSYYAIHPGGRRILEACEGALELSKNDNRFSYEVLSDYGNMSSPTVIFVLEKILNAAQKSSKQKNILSFAFGPGLTMESALLGLHYS